MPPGAFCAGDTMWTRASLLLGATALLLATACDPAAPYATGTLSLGAGIDPSGYQSLGIRFEPTAPDTGSHPRTSSVPLSGVTFPYPYGAGGGIGTSEVRIWRLTAWLSPTDPAGDEPAAGDPRAVREVDVGDCRNGCRSTTGIDLAIE